MTGKEISKYLKKNGIKQKWLAEQVGVSESLMSSMLKGKTAINADMLFSICSVLKVSSESFRTK